MKFQTIIAVCILAAALLAGMSVIGSGQISMPNSGNTPEYTTNAPISRSGFFLNTFVTVTLYDSSDAALLDGALALCEEYEKIFSKTRTDSELYRLNHRTPGEQSFTVSDDMAALLTKGLEYCRISDGAFDITVEPLSSLWVFNGDTQVIPDEEAIREAVSKIDYRSLRLDGHMLTFLSPETTIDLGSIAKGYIADQIKAYLKQAGIRHAIIDLGGNILCIGGRPDGTPFSVGLKKPFAGTSQTAEVLSIDDLSVVTSGVYERHFIIDGKNYHHLLNPVSGFPYDNGLLSVTILSTASVDGDALSTVCFSLGLDKGMALINSLENVYACFIDEEYKLYYSDGMETFLAE